MVFTKVIHTIVKFWLFMHYNCICIFRRVNLQMKIILFTFVIA